MAQTSASVYGRYTLISGQGSIWHELHNTTPGYGGLSAGGTLYADRATEQTLSCHITGSFNSHLQGQRFIWFSGYLEISLWWELIYCL